MGGAIRYLIDVKIVGVFERLKPIIYQMIMLSFTGIAFGLISADVGANFHLVSLY